MERVGGQGERGARRALTAVMAVTLGALVLAGCAQSTGSSGAAGHADRLQRPARADRRRPWWRPSSRRAGITVNLRCDDEDVLADQIVTEGSHSPADVFYTENSPPLQYLASKGLLAPVDAVDARQHAVALQLAGRQVGRRVGPGERDGLQHVAAHARPAPDVGHGAGGPEVERQDRHRRRRDRLPADRHDHRAHPRRGRGAALARGRQGERGKPRLSRQRDAHRRGQQRPGRPRHHQPVLLVPAAGPGRRGRHCTRPSPPSPRTTSATSSTSRAPASSVLEPPDRRPSASWPSSPRCRARRSSPTATATSTRSHRGSRRRSPRPRSTSCSPTGSRSPSWAQVPRRSSSCRRPSCCDRWGRDSCVVGAPPPPAPADGRRGPRLGRGAPPARLPGRPGGPGRLVPAAPAAVPAASPPRWSGTPCRWSSWSRSCVPRSGPWRPGSSSAPTCRAAASSPSWW